jgi:hypothetical protein
MLAAKPLIYKVARRDMSAGGKVRGRIALSRSDAGWPGESCDREARLREHPEWADNLLANTLGCSDMTVTAVRPEIRKLDRLLGADGKWQKAKKAPSPAKPRKPAADPPLDSKQAKALVAIRASVRWRRRDY